MKENSAKIEAPQDLLQAYQFLSRKTKEIEMINSMVL